MTAALLYVAFLLAVIVGAWVLAIFVAVGPRPLPARLLAAEDDDPDTAATLDEMLSTAEARAPAASTLTALERRLYHG